MLATINAAGLFMPPLFIIKGKTQISLSPLETQNVPPGSLFAFQKKAWMEDTLSTHWFVDIFVKNCGAEAKAAYLG